MKVHPQFSGVYLKPTHAMPLESSPTGHGFFEHNGKSYYTTHEDTVTLHRARQDESNTAVLTNLYEELASKAPAETLTLAGMLAAQISNRVLKK